MWLRTLAGAYAGQIRDYGMVAGFNALRSGTAEKVGPHSQSAVAAPVTVEKKRKGRPAVETTAAKR